MTTNDQILFGQLLQDNHKDLAPQMTPSAFFELFTAQQVLKDFELSYDEIECGLMGGSGDGGIDGIYFLINGDLLQEDTEHHKPKANIVLDLFIIQSKLGNGFQETPVERFITFSTDLFNLGTTSAEESAYTAIYNQRLVDFICRFKETYKALATAFPKFNIHYVYASQGITPSSSVEHKVAMLKDKVLSLITDADFDFQFLGASQLLALARHQPKTTHKLLLAEIPISSGDQVGFIALVKITEFFTFITEDSGSLNRHMFDTNVRDYQGNTEVNEEIRQSLNLAGTEEFWWLNNGVSILASQASMASKTLTIANPQIVNGLQTSTEIYNYCSNPAIEDEKRTILVRVMVPEEEESRDRIIKATNSQTALSPSSLKATDKIQRDIEEHLRPKGLFYDRRKNYYKNAGKPKDKIVGIPYLAQAVMAILLQKPDQARARPSSLLKSGENYEQVFNSLYPINLYHVCAEVMKRVEGHLKSPALGVSAEHRNNLRFYVAMHTVGGASGSAIPTPNKVAEFDINGLNEQSVKASVDYVQPKYLALGGNDQVAKGPQLLTAILEDAPTI